MINSMEFACVCNLTIGKVVSVILLYIFCSCCIMFTILSLLTLEINITHCDIITHSNILTCRITWFIHRSYYVLNKKELSIQNYNVTGVD